MAASWPFFQSMLDNMEMVLAKSDMSIARRYATLVADRTLAETLFNRIETAWNVAHDTLLDITGQTRLLEKHPALEESIRLRLPYIEPLNLLQVELLKRHRAGRLMPGSAKASSCPSMRSRPHCVTAAERGASTFRPAAGECWPSGSPVRSASRGAYARSEKSGGTRCRGRIPVRCSNCDR